MQPAPSASAAPALTENDATFAAGMRLVRKTGTYPKDRVLAVAGYAGATAGVLIVTIVLTALLSSVSKLAASVVFLVGVVGVFLGLSFYVDRKLFADSNVTRQFVRDAVDVGHFLGDLAI